MTKRWIASMVLIGGLMVVPVQSWAQQGQGMGMGMGMGVRGWGDCGGCQALASLPKQDLSSAEVAGLSYMREEEKLARDVYTKLYEVSCEGGNYRLTGCKRGIGSGGKSVPDPEGSRRK